MKRKQFTFYESFASALKRIRKKADRADAYDAIVDYALYGIEPDMDKLPDSAAIAFELIRPNLDASKRKAEGGKNGGSAKQSESIAEACGKHSGSMSEANGKESSSKQEGYSKRGETASEKEKEGEKEKEVENECYPPTPLSGGEKARVPTFDSVLAYARMCRAEELAKPFFDYYAAADWRDSENKPVYNWQQKFVAWRQRDEEKKKARQAKGIKTAPAEAPADPAGDFARMQRLRDKLRKEADG